MEKADYFLYADWNRDGDYGEANEDLSAYIVNQSLSWEYGIDSDSERSKFGLLRATLDNSDSRFSSFNTASPLYGLILPGVPVKLTMKIGAGSEVTQFVAFLAAIVPQPGPTVSTSTAELVAYGPLSRTSKARVSLAMQTAKTTGQLLDLVLDAVDSDIARAIDATCLSTISRFWITRERSALDIANELQDAECGTLRENKLGQIAFESRAHRAAHSVAATFGSGGLYLWNPKQEDPVRGIYNHVEAEVHTFNKSEDSLLAVVSDVRSGLAGTPPVVPAKVGGVDGTLTVTIPFPTPSSPSNFLAVDDWGTVDVEVNTAADGTGTDITNSSITLTRAEYADRIEVTFTNTNALAGYVILLRAHGTAIVEGDPIPVSAFDQTSQDNYDKQAYPNPSRWLTDLTEGQDYCDHIIAMRKDPPRKITFELRANYDAAHLAQAQARDVSDKIHVDATVGIYGLGLDQDFYIEYVRHSVNAARLHTVQYECRAVVTHSWLASGTAYTARMIADGVPDDLYVNSIDPDMHMVFGCRAWKNNKNITGARFRAKLYTSPVGSDESVDLRTVAEGGTMAHDPANGMYVVDTPFFANQYGAQYEFDSLSEGFWYFAFQLISSAGDSVWSDGNRVPRYVKDYAETDAEGASTGPPADWWVEVIPDPSGRHAVIVRASRPKTNGHKIWRWIAQIKDGSTGAWRSISDNAGAANVYYGDISDSGYGDIPHVSSNNNTRLTRGANPMGGLQGEHYLLGDYAHIGDLILLDPRGGVWAEEYCGWGTIDSIQGLKTGFDVATADYFDVAGRFHNTVTSDLRLLVVSPPWAWNTEGYFGGEPNHGLYERWYWDNGEHGDTTTQVFESDPIDVPASVDLGVIQARVWFDNGFSTSDGGLITGTVSQDSGNPSGASGLEVLTNVDDPSIPVGSVAFRWNRETANYHGIYAIAAWLSTSLPAEGPYYDERTAASPTTILETGICTVAAGDKHILCYTDESPAAERAGSSPAGAVLGKVFLIYTDDATPDSDLDGNVIVDEGPGFVTLSDAFRKSGSFHYAIVDCWWPNEGSSNIAFFQWAINQVTYDVEKSVWQTPPVPWPSGTYYVTLANRNLFGLGTRLIAGGASTPDPPHQYVSAGCVELSISGGAVATNTDAGRVFSIDASGDFTLSNPTGTHYCGMTLLWMITGSGIPTLDSKFRLMDGESIDKSSGRDLLAAIYNATDDEWDTFFKKGPDSSPA